MADRSVRIQVRGIRELDRAFRQVSDGVDDDGLKSAFLEIATSVSTDAASMYPFLRGAASGSVKARASRSRASIAFGGRAAEYAPWLDFGGRVGRNRSIQRELVKGGRYVYPTIAKHRAEIGRKVDDAIESLARRAGFDTSGSAD